MSIYPAPLEHLIKNLSRLPGIGQKSAARVALHILRSPKELAESLAKSLVNEEMGKLTHGLNLPNIPGLL